MNGWRENAACRQRTATMFDKARRAEACSLCEQCPAAEVCLWATMIEEDPVRRYGVAGGMTSGQRHALAQRVSPEVVRAAHTAAQAAWEVRTGSCRREELADRARPPEPAAQRRQPAPVQDPVSAEVIAVVAEAYGMEAGHLCGPSRTRHLVDARQVAMFVMREVGGMSFPAIGAAVGRDHTTAMSAVARVRTQMAERPALRRGIQRLVARLNGETSGPLSAALGDGVGDAAQPDGSLGSDAVLAEVSRVFGVAVQEMRGVGRARHVCGARHVAMYALREVRGLSYPAIGQALGGRDHTTVMHGVDRVRRALSEPGMLGRQASVVLAALRAAGVAAA